MPPEGVSPGFNRTLPLPPSEPAVDGREARPRFLGYGSHRLALHPHSYHLEAVLLQSPEVKAAVLIHGVYREAGTQCTTLFTFLLSYKNKKKKYT